LSHLCGQLQLLVIHISDHVDILKAKTAVQTLEFRWGETAKSRMARRYTHTRSLRVCVTW